MSRDKSFVCPGCNLSEISVMYSGPLSYKCKTCNQRLVDDNDEGIPVLTKEEAMAKYPGLYGAPTCGTCVHGPHEVPCRVNCKWCAPPLPHVYKFRLAP